MAIELRQQANRLWSFTTGMLLLLLVTNMYPGLAHAVVSGEADYLTAGDKFAQQGDYTEALTEWQQGIGRLQTSQDNVGLARVYQRIGEVRQVLGEYPQALQALHQASGYAADTGDKSLQHRISANIASIYVAQGNLKLADRILEKLLFEAKQSNDKPLESAVLNDHGNMLAARGYLDGATSRYQQSLQLAQQQGLWDQQLRVLFNLATVSARFHENDSYMAYVRQANQLLDTGEMDFTRAGYLLRMSELLLSVQDANPKQHEAQLTLVKTMLAKAYSFLQASKNKEQLAYALGLSGEWSAASGKSDPAREYWLQASFHAQQVDAQEQLYRWQWQLGRLARAQNENDSALVHYRNARQAYLKLNPLFTWSHIDPNQQDDTPAVFQYELADLLLTLSSTEQKTDRINALLRETIETIESLRNAELQDYFRDSCITRTREAVSGKDHEISNRTLIMYPLVFAQRVEILTRKNDQLHRFSVALKASELKNRVGLSRKTRKTSYA